MRKAFALGAFVCLLIATTLLFAPSAEAVWWTPGDRSNIIDCRSGWYCTSGGWIDWGSSWSFYWDDIIGWGA